MIGNVGIFFVIIAIVLLICGMVIKWNAEITIMLCAFSLFTGIIQISLWIVGEYISRIYDEVKGRPEYIIDKEINL